jgi:hypothetical protein
MHRYNSQGKEVIDTYDIVKVNKKTKVRPFSGHKKAHVGMTGIVVGEYTNSFGTTKLTILDEHGMEYTEADHAVMFLGTLKQEEYKKVWTQALRQWMDKTYIPVFVFHKYNHKGFPRVKSRSGEAFLMISMQNQDIWINKRNVHIDDLDDLKKIDAPSDFKLAGSGKADMKSIRIPVWVAEKNKLFGPKKISQNM